MFEFDPDAICRDENCERLDVHYKHHVQQPPCVHHRPSAATTPLWQRDDPQALAEAVIRACNAPTHFQAVMRDVQDDYGACCERTVYRYLAKLVRAGELVKAEVDLAFAVYVRPKSRLLGDLDSLREYMLGLVEMHPTTKSAHS